MIEKDKILHFVVCAIATLLAGTLAWVLAGSLTWGCITGTTFAAGLTLGKEYGDKNATGNHWCWCDLLADFGGILLAVLLLLLSNALLELLINQIIN